jgi:hypothetical protein
MGFGKSRSEPDRLEQLAFGFDIAILDQQCRAEPMVR